MGDLKKDLVNRFFGELWEDLIGYFKIYDFIKLKAHDFRGNTIDIPSVDSFWYSILGAQFVGDGNTKYCKLRHGSIVRLKDLFISEWAPKLPGRIWTKKGMEDYEAGKTEIDHNRSFNHKVSIVLKPNGKEKVVSAGYGSIRINRRKHDQTNFMYMSLVDAAKWHCDYGIPVVVSKSVYNEFVRYSSDGTPWIESLEGVLHIHDDLPFSKLLTEAIGSKLSPEVESTLRYRPGLPKCYIQIISPLSIKIKYNDSNPYATAWTLFRTNSRLQPLRYTYCNFTTNVDDSITEAVDFINWYTKEYHGVGIVTDFDGMVPRLKAEIPLNVHPIRSHKNEVVKVISECNQWAEYRLARNNNCQRPNKAL